MDYARAIRSRRRRLGVIAALTGRDEDEVFDEDEGEDAEDEDEDDAEDDDQETDGHEDEDDDYAEDEDENNDDKQQQQDKWETDHDTDEQDCGHSTIEHAAAALRTPVTHDAHPSQTERTTVVSPTTEAVSSASCPRSHSGAASHAEASSNLYACTD